MYPLIAAVVPHLISLKKSSRLASFLVPSTAPSVVANPPKLSQSSRGLLAVDTSLWIVLKPHSKYHPQ